MVPGGKKGHRYRECSCQSEAPHALTAGNLGNSLLKQERWKVNLCINLNVSSESSTGLHFNDLKVGINKLCGASEGAPFQISITQKRELSDFSYPHFS